MDKKEIREVFAMLEKDEVKYRIKPDTLRTYINTVEFFLKKLNELENIQQIRNYSNDLRDMINDMKYQIKIKK